MGSNCRRSCGLCSGETRCADDLSDCKLWAPTGGVLSCSGKADTGGRATGSGHRWTEEEEAKLCALAEWVLLKTNQKGPGDGKWATVAKLLGFERERESAVQQKWQALRQRGVVEQLARKGAELIAPR